MQFLVTKEDVIDIAQELSDLTARQWEVALRNARLQINLSTFVTEERANMVAAYLVAHIATRIRAAAAAGSGLGGAAGPLSSITVGSVSKTFRTPGNVDTAAGSSSDFNTTTYGREYLRLVRTYGTRIGVA